MSTPPLDLTALHPSLAEAVARGDAAYGAGGDAEAVALAAAAPLLDRAEAAEAKVAAVREALVPHGNYGHDCPGDCIQCILDAVRAALDGGA